MSENAPLSEFAQLCFVLGQLDVRLKSLEGRTASTRFRRPRPRRKASLLDQTKGQVIPFRARK